MPKHFCLCKTTRVGWCPDIYQLLEETHISTWFSPPQPSSARRPSSAPSLSSPAPPPSGGSGRSWFLLSKGQVVSSTSSTRQTSDDRQWMQQHRLDPFKSETSATLEAFPTIQQMIMIVRWITVSVLHSGVKLHYIIIRFMIFYTSIHFRETLQIT